MIRHSLSSRFTHFKSSLLQCFFHKTFGRTKQKLYLCASFEKTVLKDVFFMENTEGGNK